MPRPRVTQLLRPVYVARLGHSRESTLVTMGLFQPGFHCDWMNPKISKGFLKTGLMQV